MRVAQWLLVPLLIALSATVPAQAGSDGPTTAAPTSSFRSSRTAPPARSSASACDSEPSGSRPIAGLRAANRDTDEVVVRLEDAGTR